MGVTTRSASSSPVKKAAAAPPTIVTKPEQQQAPNVLLLPSALSSDARILNLRHPRDGLSKRFLFCPAHGLYEFTRVSHEPSEYRSMLFSKLTAADNVASDSQQPSMRSHGYIAKEAQIMVATKFDMCFLLFALLPSTMAGATKALFQPLDDLFEDIVSKDRHLRYVITNGRKHVEEAMGRISDMADAGDERMYRISEPKTMVMLQQKVARIVEKGLPATLEERFVTRTLETPVLSVKREESKITVSAEDMDVTEDGAIAQTSDTQSSTASSAPSVVFSEVSAASTTTTVELSEGVSTAITHLQRQRVALDFIVGSYLPSKVAAHVLEAFVRPDSPIDFTPLVDHMANLSKLKAEALAARSFGDFSRKRGLDEEEAAEERAEKKRKQDEDEKKRKANTSRGVKDLAKVNVSGMKKMSAFFTKKATLTKS